MHLYYMATSFVSTLYGCSWMIPCKRNSLGILCVEMLLSSETKFQIEENPTVIHEHKTLELNVKSNTCSYPNEDLTATLCSSPYSAVLNLSNCKHITLAEIEFKKLENLVFVCLTNTSTTPKDDSSQISVGSTVFS